MRYLSGGLSHENKFPVKFAGPNLFFPWLLVFYHLTDAFVLVLSRHLHHIHIHSRHLNHIHILYAEAVVCKCSSK